MRIVTLPVLLGLGVLVLTGCNDDNDIVDPTPGFSMSISPDEVTLEPGGTAEVDVGIQRTGGFDGNVNLTVEDLPDGVTAEGETIGSAATSETITLQADPAADEGTTTAQVRGSGTGVDDEVATLEVTVGEPEPEEGFALSLDPDSVEIEQEAQDEVTVQVDRFGDWDGAVTLAVDDEAEDFPDDVEFTFEPATVDPEANTSALTVEVGADADPGEYTITVTGTADDEEAEDQEVDLFLEVVESD